MQGGNMKRAGALLLLLAGLLPLAARAATCAVVATPHAFGTYSSPGGAQTDSGSTLTVTCTPDKILLSCSTSYSIALSAGTSASYGPRQLASGAARLNYNLYTSAARSTVWGDGSGGSNTVSGTINTSLLGLLCLAGSNNHTVYGRIPAAQNVSSGIYADTITVTVTF
jgi:spore coat protein U-like protein